MVGDVKMNQLDKRMTLEKLNDFPENKKMSIGFKLLDRQGLIDAVSSESHIGHLIVKMYKESDDFMKQQKDIWS